MMSSPEEKTVGWADVRIRALAPDSSTFFTVSPNSCMAFLILSLVYNYCKRFPFRICSQQALAVSKFSHLQKFQVEGVDRGPSKLYLGTKSQDYLLQSLPDLKNSQPCQIWHIYAHCGNSIVVNFCLNKVWGRAAGGEEGWDEGSRVDEVGRQGGAGRLGGRHPHEGSWEHIWNRLVWDLSDWSEPVGDGVRAYMCRVHWQTGFPYKCSQTHS